MSKRPNENKTRDNDSAKKAKLAAFRSKSSELKNEIQALQHHLELLESPKTKEIKNLFQFRAPTLRDNR